jgi:hypothetical protein
VAREVAGRRWRPRLGRSVAVPRPLLVAAPVGDWGRAAMCRGAEARRREGRPATGAEEAGGGWGGGGG